MKNRKLFIFALAILGGLQQLMADACTDYINSVPPTELECMAVVGANACRKSKCEEPTGGSMGPECQPLYPAERVYSCIGALAPSWPLHFYFHDYSMEAQETRRTAINLGVGAPVQDSLLGANVNNFPIATSIASVNHPPQGMTAYRNTPMDIPLFYTSVAADADSDPIIRHIVHAPLYGSLNVVGNQYQYTPSNGFVGSDRMVILLNDNKGGYGFEVLNVTVGSPANRAPVGDQTPRATGFGQTSTFLLTPSDPELNPITITTMKPIYGTANVSGHSITYTPKATHYGVDEFVYFMKDSVGNEFADIIYMFVQDAPLTSVNVRVDNPTTGQVVATGSTVYGASTVNMNLGAVSAGLHDFHFIAQNQAGQTAISTRRYYVDNQKPVVNWLSAPAENAFVRGSISFSVQAVDDAPNNIESVKLIDPSLAIMNMLASDQSDTWVIPAYNTTLLSDGNATFRIEAIDRAHNNSVQLVRTLRIDNSAPGIAMNVSNGQKLKGMAALTMTGTDAGSGVTGMELYLQNGGGSNLLKNSSNGSLSHNLNTANYSDGAWTLRGRALDALGNQRETNIAISIDNTAPIVNIANIPEPGTTLSTFDQVILTATDANGIATVAVSIDGAPRTVVPGPGNTYNLMPPYTTPGIHTVTVAVTDNAGNTTTQQFLITIQNNVPTAQSQTLTTVKNTAKAITLVGSTSGLQTLTYQIVSDPSHGTLMGTAPNVTYTPTSNYVGADSFTFKVNNGISDSVPAAVNITVQNTAPNTVAHNQTLTLNEDGTISITLTATDPQGDPLTYFIVNQPANGTLSGTAPNLTYTPNPNFNGMDSFTFKVNDGSADSNIATVVFSVNSVNDQPTIVTKSHNDGDYVNGDNELEIRVTDDGTISNIEAEIDGSIPVTVIDNGGGVYIVDWNPDQLPEGAHTVEITITDNNGGTTTETIQIFVDHTDPTVTSVVPSNNSTVSGTVNIGANVGDTAQLDSVQVFIDGVLVTSPGISGTSGTVGYSWDTTTASNGSHTITIVATDEAGNTTTTTRNVVVSNGVAPEIMPQFDVMNPQDNKAVRGLVTLRMQITSGTVVSAGFKIGAGAFIPGTDVGGGRFEYSWVTTSVTDGFYTIEFSAANNAGTTKKTIQVRVDNTAPSVAVTYPSANATLFLVQNLQANASDNGQKLSTVRFRIDAQEAALFSGNANPLNTLYSYAVDTELLNNQGVRVYPDGAHTLYVIATDEAGNEVQDTLPFNIDNANIPSPQNALVEVHPAQGGFVVTDGESAISAKIQNVQVDAAAFTQGSQNRLVVSVVKDGATISPYPGTVRLVNDTVEFIGNVPANSQVSCSLSVPVLENGDLKHLVQTWNFTRGMDDDMGGSVSTADGVLTLSIPPRALPRDAFVDIEKIAQATQEIREADSAFSNLFGNQKVVYGPMQVSARDASNAAIDNLNVPALMSYARPAQNIPPAEHSFVDQVQVLKGVWRPLASSGNHLQTSSVNPGARSINVPVQSFGLFRVTSFAVPNGGISDVFNFPNPFSPQDGGTDFHYMLGSDSEVNIVIYDLLGNLVRRFDIPAGAIGGKVAQNIFHWDGRNGEGDKVANGGYIVQIRAKDASGSETKAIRKVGIVK